MSIRNIVIAGTIAIGAALSAGAANASPAIDLNIPMVTESAVAQVQYGYQGNHGYGYGQRRLCRLPFFVLVKHFGFWRAKQIKRNCYTPYYGYNSYNSYNNYKSY